MDYKQRKLVFSTDFQVDFNEDILTDLLDDNQILIKTEYSLISPGTELAMYTKSHPGFKDPDNTWAQYPFYPGYAGVGVVLGKGANIDKFEEGDKIFAYMPHANYNIVTMEDNLPVVKVDNSIPFDKAVFCRLAAISLTSIYKSQFSIGDRVVITGMGLIGNLAAQLFELAGADVIGIDVVESRLDIAKQTGISKTINAGSVDDIKAEVVKLFKGKEADIVVEATGVPALVNQAMEMVRKNGQVIMLGSTRGIVELDVYTYIHNKGIILTGAHEMLQGVDNIPDRIQSTEYVLDLIAKGALKVKPLITDIISPTDAKDGYDRLINEKDCTLGILYNWQEL